MRRIAITGGIGEGKSTILGYCKDAGFSVASADEFARQIFLREDVQRQLSELLRLPLPLRPAEVRAAIGKHPRLRRILNGITHKQIASALFSSSAQIVEVPLLIETCMQGSFSRVWVVTCGAKEQFTRLSARVGEEQAKELLRAQLPTSAKLPFADTIIRTNQPEDHVKRSVLACLNREFGDASV